MQQCCPTLQSSNPIALQLFCLCGKEWHHNARGVPADCTCFWSVFFLNVPKLLCFTLIVQGGYKLSEDFVTPGHQIWQCVISSCGGFVKDNVYIPPHPKTLPELRERINTAIGNVTQDMFGRVWREWEYGLDICRVTRGAHIECI